MRLLFSNYFQSVRIYVQNFRKIFVGNKRKLSGSIFISANPKAFKRISFVRFFLGFSVLATNKDNDLQV